MTWAGWAEIDNRWPLRLADIGRLIPPGSSVIDLGAGAQALQDHLHDCTYTAADLHQRTPWTLAFDMNGDVWPEGRWDVAVMAGVLEYADDPRDVLVRVRHRARTAIITYRHRLNRGDLSVPAFKRTAHTAGWREVRDLGKHSTGRGGKYRLWRLR